MFRRVGDFQKAWEQERDATLKVLQALSDASLAQAVTKDDRTLGRLAWHLATTLGEMMERTGLSVGGPSHESPPPASAAAIVAAYDDGRTGGGRWCAGLDRRDPRGRGRHVRREVAPRTDAAGAGRPPGAPPRPDDGPHATGRPQGPRRLRAGPGGVDDLRHAAAGGVVGLVIPRDPDWTGPEESAGAGALRIPRRPSRPRRLGMTGQRLTATPCISKRAPNSRGPEPRKARAGRSLPK